MATKTKKRTTSRASASRGMRKTTSAKKRTTKKKGR